MPERPDSGGSTYLGVSRGSDALVGVGGDVRHDAFEMSRLPDAPMPGEGGVVKKRLGFMFWLAAGWLVFLILIAAAAPYLPLEDPREIANGAQYERPSAEHWFGTDKLGRDMLSRTIEGARVSLTVGISAIIVALFIGGAIGLIAGFRRGGLERGLMACMDILLAFPALVLALAIATFVGREMRDIIIVFAVVSIAPLARLARANALQWSQREFVQAARVLGAKDRSIMVREVLPNILMPMLYLALIGISLVIVAEATLAVLGLGIINKISWGGMIVDGIDGFAENPHVVFIPCLAIFLVVLPLNFLGERLRVLTDARESAL